jgi:hypothetical protein
MTRGGDPSLRPPDLEPGRARAPERRRARDRRARQTALRRRRQVAALILVTAIAAGAASLSGVGSSGAGNGRGTKGPSQAIAQDRVARESTVRAGRPQDPGRRVQRTVPAASAPGSIRAHSTTSPGSLPQTHAFPSASDPRFRSLTASLWDGIQHGSLERALPAFFPKDAYERLKAIAGAGSDWTNRLVHDYGLDIAAAHALLGRDAHLARLDRVEVRPSYGHWIEPGVCYNSAGYYEMPDARVIYSLGGHTRSFGIASMISWRGVWYVVHLGAVLRSTDVGVVDEPAAGPGVSVYSGTC